MTLEDILALEDVDQKIEYLKKGRKTEEPNTGENWKDWNADLHEIIVDKEKYPDIEVVEEKEREEWNDSTGKSTTIPAKKRTEPCNRISIPLEQDITNIQTAFTVGVEPKMDCAPSNEDEKGLFYAIQQVLKKNKIKYQNKRIVRSWLSEQECAEYWYAVKDDSFWAKFWNKIQKAFGGSVRPQNKLRSVIWSPFRGDKLYPFFDDAGDLVAFSREYKKKDRPQRGRYRQFTQCDIDILGEPSNLAEIELITATTTTIGRLGFENFEIRINERRILKAMAAYSGFAEEDYDSVFITLDKMDKIGVEGVASELAQDGYPQENIDKYLDLFKLLEQTRDVTEGVKILSEKLGEYLDEEVVTNMTEIATAVNATKGAKEISESFIENWEVWQIVGFLERFGLGAESAKKVYDLLGINAISVNRMGNRQTGNMYRRRN